MGMFMGQNGAYGINSLSEVSEKWNMLNNCLR
jgi:hypothetical protein